MNAVDAYEKLCQISFIDPNYKPVPGHSTFLVIQLTQPKGNELQLHTLIVDPAMPEQGGPDDYLNMQPMQRLALEYSEIVDSTSQYMASVATHAPEDLEMIKKADGDNTTMCRILRFLSRKAAMFGIHKSLESDPFIQETLKP